MTTSAQTPAHAISRTVPASAAHTRPRPDLPSWFGGATTFLYAVCGGLALVLAGVALTAALTSVPHELLVLAVPPLVTLESAIVLGVGGWCHTIARSRRVDPTTPQLDPVWFIAAWFIPIVHLFVPHRMFGDLWASAKWQQSDRRGSNTPLAPRPWIIAMWAWAWGLGFAWALTTFFRDVDATFIAVHLVLAAASTGLLAGVVRVIHRVL